MKTMNRDQAKELVRSEWETLIQDITQEAGKMVKGHMTYICPLPGCHHGEHKKRGIQINTNASGDYDPLMLHCFECEWTGDIIALYMETEKVGYIEAVDKLAAKLGVKVANSTPQNATEAPQSDFKERKEAKPMQQPKPGLYKELIENSIENAEKGKDYFKSRGFTDETVKRFNLGYVEQYEFYDSDTDGKVKRPGIIIPYTKDYSYYIARSTEKKMFDKPKTEEAGGEPVYNKAALYEERPCFVCESPLDAISIMQAGGNAVAVGGTGAEKLRKQVTEKRPEMPLILCFDNDEAGRKANGTASEFLTEMKIPFIEGALNLDEYQGDKKDANDLLRSNEEQLKKDIKANEKEAEKKAAFIPYKVSDYLAGGGFESDISYFKEYKDRKTGFENIDQYLTLYPGMAALGGSASVGKTTFCINLADNLIKAGETVLYFSLEQEPIELVTKSLARRVYEIDPCTPMTNTEIKGGGNNDDLERAKKEYAEKADRFIIARCNFKTTANDLKRYIESFIKKTGTRPVVFIDYLQLIAPVDNFRGDIRAATDETIKILKDMQRENELLVILVSNFNRTSYNSPASYADFKETGMIEYTCDYIWTLQLAIMDNDKFYNAEKGKEKKAQSDKLYEAQTSTDAKTHRYKKAIQFRSLKSRNGLQAYKCNFDYYMQNDVFIPGKDEDEQASEDDTKKTKAPEGFEVVADSDKVPF